MEENLLIHRMPKFKKNYDTFIQKQILDRWAEYINELFKNHGKNYIVMNCNFAWPPTMREEFHFQAVI